jgi:hypothetical protein
LVQLFKIWNEAKRLISNKLTPADLPHEIYGKIRGNFAMPINWFRKIQATAFPADNANANSQLPANVVEKQIKVPKKKIWFGRSQAEVFPHDTDTDIANSQFQANLVKKRIQFLLVKTLLVYERLNAFYG